jgi:glycosyltransferase involved in cell wall biosynthesis
MADVTGKIVFFYDDDAYVEPLGQPSQEAVKNSTALMGRQVAGCEFLDAYLTHGSWTELVALVREPSQADSLFRFCEAHPSSRAKRRSLRVIEEGHFHQFFFPTPPASLLYTPCPPDPRYAWARQHGGPCAFALSGVTHTLCTMRAVDCLCDYVTAPLEAYDSLICTSRTAVRMVQAVTNTYADYLRDRHGGSPESRIRLEMIPLGVNPDKFHPPTSAERATQRKALQIGEEELVVLFVGRLSYHAKAHPFPMFQGIAQAATRTGRKVRLVLSGWAAESAVLDAFREGAGNFAPGVRLSIVDGTDPQKRFAVWHAADIFVSLVDNIQETFGLAVLEAMASGLPVVASDWDGYRDLVVPGETGYLVPTRMVPDATSHAASRLLLGEVNYEGFLAECSQCVAVDSTAAAEALARLILDAELRRHMGTAGRQRVLSCFAWSQVIKAYEQLWREQEHERLAFAGRRGGSSRTARGPARYPAPEDSFAGYPTSWLKGDDFLQASAGAPDRLERVLAMPLTNHSAHARTTDMTVLRAILASTVTPRSVVELDGMLRQANVPFGAGRATVAWMLKYDLLRIARSK